MRYLLVAALALSACHRAPGPGSANPTNKAPEADYRGAAADELGFLPIDSDFVIGFDLVALRNSRMWAAFKPQIEAATRKIPELSGACGVDFIASIERVTLALKVIGEDEFAGVFVVHGRDMNRALQCTVTEAKKKGGTATVDRGVTITTDPKQPGMRAASMVIASSTLVIQIDKTVSRDTLVKLLDAGAPLRQSQVFMRMFERRERGASLWGMANGNSKAFAELARSGFRPKSMDGTIVVNDKMVVALRMAMQTATEAAQLQAEVDKLKGPAGSYVERFDSRVDGDVVGIDVAVTEAQLRALVGMVGGMMGP